MAQEYDLSRGGEPVTAEDAALISSAADDRSIVNDALESGLPTPRRYWSALAIWLAMSMSVIDGSLTSIALPTIAQELGASPSAAIWIVNAYQIAIAMLLLPIAAIGEIVGYKRVYQIGVGLFILSSLGCALADNLTHLAIARFVQGFGVASVFAINGALVRFTYPRAQLGRGIGYNALVIATTSAAGPTVAAAVLAVASWHWIFAINIPLGLLSLIIGMRCLPAPPLVDKRFNVQSAVLSALTFGALFLGCVEFAQRGVSLLMAGMLVIGLAAAIILVRKSRAEPAPLLPLDLMRMPILKLSYATSSCSFGAQMIALISLPFYFQERFGFNHVETGLMITPMPVSIAISAPIAGRLVERMPAGLLCGIGLVTMGAGFLMLAVLPVHASPLLIGTAMAVGGVGFAFFQTPNNRTLIGVAPPHRSGAAAGMLATSRLVGQAAGAALVALIFRMAGAGTALPLLLATALSIVAAVFSFRRLSLQ